MVFDNQVSSEGKTLVTYHGIGHLQASGQSGSATVVVGSRRLQRVCGAIITVRYVRRSAYQQINQTEAVTLDPALISSAGAVPSVTLSRRSDSRLPSPSAPLLLTSASYLLQVHVRARKIRRVAHPSLSLCYSAPVLRSRLRLCLFKGRAILPGKLRWTCAARLCERYAGKLHGPSFA